MDRWLWFVTASLLVFAGCQAPAPATDPFLRTRVPPPGTGAATPGAPYYPSANQSGAPAELPVDPYSPPGGSYQFPQGSRSPAASDGWASASASLRDTASATNTPAGQRGAPAGRLAQATFPSGPDPDEIDNTADDRASESDTLPVARRSRGDRVLIPAAALVEPEDTGSTTTLVTWDAEAEPDDAAEDADDTTSAPVELGDLPKSAAASSGLRIRPPTQRAPFAASDVVGRRPSKIVVLERDQE